MSFALPPIDKTTSFKYKPAIDSLRAVAVIFVIMHHTNAIRVPGGGIGVDLFFSISGFLITALLVQEYSQNKKINIIKFYGRRALRLFPALWVMLVVSYFFIKPNFLVIYSVLFYFSNWATVAGVDLGPYGHTWSLSVEEQFYMVWVLLVIGFLYLGSVFSRRYPHRVLLLSTVFFTVISVTHRILLLKHGELDWAYNGTDARAYGFLLGGIAALLIDFFKKYYSTWRFKIVSFLSFLIICKFALTHSITGTVYDSLIVSVVCTQVVLWCNFNSANTIFKNKYLVFTGKISYAIYLWHFPLIFILPHIESKYLFFIIFSLSFLIACLSWFLVEKPLTSKLKKFVSS